MSTPTQDLFHTPAQVELPAAVETRSDPMRPQVVRGRYPLPDPVTGKARTWQRVSNLIKMAEDTYHLDAWKMRNVAKGLAMRPDLVTALVPLEVKADKDRMNAIIEKAQEVAGAYKMSDEGTDLHKSTELADHAGGDLSVVKPSHRKRVQHYLDAMRANGLTVTPGMIERVTVSARYDVAGTFDRIVTLGDGSHAIFDVKTGSSLDFSMPSISAQLACYEDGVNTHGVWDGARYDTSIRVRTDFGIVVHLPSDRDEVSMHRIDLGRGHAKNRICVAVRDERRVKAKHVAEAFSADAYRAADATAEADWLEVLNASHTVAELIDVAARTRSFGQWTERLATQARLLAGELAQAERAMGS